MKAYCCDLFGEFRVAGKWGNQQSVVGLQQDKRLDRESQSVMALNIMLRSNFLSKNQGAIRCV